MHVRRTSSVVCWSLVFLLSTALSGQAGSAKNSKAEIQAMFTEYLRLHATKDMAGWQKLFLPEAICVRTADDGKVAVYPVAQLAESIAEEAKTLQSQHETFHEVRIDVDGDAATYSTLWKLYHNGKLIRQGRAYFSLARKDGKWMIAALVWYRHSGSGVR